MNALREFLHMGGYAFYVWGAYLLTLLVLGLHAILPRLRERQLLRSISARDAGAGSPG